MLTIDYLTGRESDAPAKMVIVSSRAIEGATKLAEMALAEIVAGAAANGPRVIGYAIRDDGGAVVRRLYNGLG